MEHNENSGTDIYYQKNGRWNDMRTGLKPQVPEHTETEEVKFYLDRNGNFYAVGTKYGDKWWIEQKLYVERELCVP
jgi:hypothetical protein